MEYWAKLAPDLVNFVSYYYSTIIQQVYNGVRDHLNTQYMTLR